MGCGCSLDLAKDMRILETIRVKKGYGLSLCLLNSLNHKPVFCKHRSVGQLWKLKIKEWIITDIKTPTRGN